MMTKKAPRRLNDTRQHVAQALNLFRAAIPAGELEEHDWESIRVAVRVVYETEELGALLHREVTRDRVLGITDWSDSLESAISFMSWVRTLTSIVKDATYSSRLPVSVPALWRTHRALAVRLLNPKLAPADRLSVLVKLGGIEVSLWGLTWALEPMRFRLPENAPRRQGNDASRKRKA